MQTANLLFFKRCRLTQMMSIKYILLIVWLAACLLSIPHVINVGVANVEVLPTVKVARCQQLPSIDQQSFLRILTLLTFITQYLIPLLVSGLAYASVAYRILNRARLGK